MRIATASLVLVAVAGIAFAVGKQSEVSPSTNTTTVTSLLRSSPRTLVTVPPTVYIPPTSSYLQLAQERSAADKRACIDLGKDWASGVNLCLDKPRNTVRTIDTAAGSSQTVDPSQIVRDFQKEIDAINKAADDAELKRKVDCLANPFWEDKSFCQ